jgi:hypothetical protein
VVVEALRVIVALRTPSTNTCAVPRVELLYAIQAAPEAVIR